MRNETENPSNTVIDSPAESMTIECRPPFRSKSGVYLLVLIEVLMCLVLVGIHFAVIDENRRFPERQQSQAIWQAVAQCFIGAGGIFVAVAILGDWRRTVRADISGLLFTSRRGQKQFLSWTEVADYYLVPSKQTRYTSSVVVGWNGKRFSFPHDWPTGKQLEGRIRESAKQARVREWAALGVRPHDNWPRTFHYHTRANCITPYILSPLLIVGALVLTSLTYQHATWSAPFVGWGFCLTLTGITGCVLGGLAAYIVAGIVPDHFTRQRIHERITLQAEGVHFSGNAGEMFATWEQITDARFISRHYFASSHYFVQTTQGDFIFSDRIEDSRILRDAVVYNAPQVREWKLPEDNQALPVRHVTTSGVFVHHYRTRNNRAGLIALWGLWSFAPFMTLLQTLMSLNMLAWDFLLGWSALLLPPLSWLIWRYFSARIDRDTDGLTFYGVFGKRYVLWSQITDFRLILKDQTAPEGLIGVIDSRAGRFAFFTNLSEKDRLIRAIESHLHSSSLPQKETESSKAAA